MRWWRKVQPRWHEVALLVGIAVWLGVEYWLVATERL